MGRMSAPELPCIPDLDSEARAWLDVDASRLGEFEPYDFQGRDPYTLGEPVRVTADGQILIGEQ